MKKIKVNDLFPYTMIFAQVHTLIFNVLAQKEDLNGFINNNNKETLNQEFYLSHSAEKFISPFVEKLFDNGEQASGISTFVANICYNKFGVKWKKIYDALVTEYNPLENYSMEEIRTPDLTSENTENVNTDIEVSRETSASNSYKGFNADDPVIVNQTDGDETTTTSGGSQTNEKHNVSTETGTETLTRAGNIGVTTSQQMLESEFKVRQYDFYNMIYNDIDTILCLQIY